MNDRITIAVKIGDGNFGSKLVSYDTAIREGETPDAAAARARAMVEGQLADLAAADAGIPRRGHRAPPAPRTAKVDQIERFDPRNPNHVTEARELLRRVRVTTERRQEHYFNVLLPGVSMETLGDFIYEEANRFANERAASDPYRRGTGRR